MSKRNTMATAGKTLPRLLAAAGLTFVLVIPPAVLAAGSAAPEAAPGAATGASASAQLASSPGFPLVQLPPGFMIEKVVDGLTYTTGMTWDDQGRMYVLEAGGQFVEEEPPSRILRIEPGRATEVADLAAMGVADSAVGITWHNGAFLVTHRDSRDRSGAVSRVTLDGQRTQLFSGIMDSQSEHQINDVKIGPDGRAYVAVGPASNAGVVGIDLAPFTMRSPGVHHHPCQEIVLTGRNYRTPDFRSREVQGDLANTGAFVPFGTPTEPGQVIKGTNKCGGAILVFDPASPASAEATLRPYAHGFRNVIGVAWTTRGEMYAGVNGYDIRGSRSVRDEWDATYRVQEGVWYGWPDFSAALEPVTERKFEVPDANQAPVFMRGVAQGKDLGFVIDHAASGLMPPDRSLVAGLHLWNSSPSMLDVAPASWGDMAGQLFVAEWGDLAPPTNPLAGSPSGYQITRIDPASKRAMPFARNAKLGPASAQGAPGMGLERPFDVKFGPDGAMYISDYGVARINPARTAEGKPPYEFPVGTGAIWKISRTAAGPGEFPHAIDGRTIFDEPMPTQVQFRAVYGGRTLEEWAAQHTAELRAARSDRGSATYRVTIENLTQGQPFSPPVLAAHGGGFDMFEVGRAASDELAAIAQDGEPGPMFLAARASGSVTEAVNAGAAVPPKGMLRREIRANHGDRLSIASMLVCTNDGFWALDAVALPAQGAQSFMATGYDAGREQNTEQSEHIVDTCSIPRPLPGDNDGNMNRPVASNPVEPIRDHPGVKGTGELDPGFHGFANPVARITVERVGA